MKFKKAVPVIGILFLAAAGVGIAKESTSRSNPSTSPARLVSVSNPDLTADTLDIKNEISRLEHRLKTLSSGKPNNPDLKEDIAAVKAKIARLRARLRTLRAEGANPDLTADIAAVKKKIALLRIRLRELRTNSSDFDRNGRDLQDRESPEASLHHDGDDHRLERGRWSALEGGPHREATREIMRGAHERIVALYSPTHQAGYHAKMHRHSR